MIGVGFDGAVGTLVGGDFGPICRLPWQPFALKDGTSVVDSGSLLYGFREFDLDFSQRRA